MELVENNRTYCLRRAAEEQEAAHLAADERAAQAHRELARHFEELAIRVPPLGAGYEQLEPAGTLSSEFRIIG